jgi:hypothetical protein
LKENGIGILSVVRRVAASKLKLKYLCINVNIRFGAVATRNFYWFSLQNIPFTVSRDENSLLKKIELSKMQKQNVFLPTKCVWKKIFYMYFIGTMQV